MFKVNNAENRTTSVTSQFSVVKFERIPHVSLSNILPKYRSFADAVVVIPLTFSPFDPG